MHNSGVVNDFHGAHKRWDERVTPLTMWSVLGVLCAASWIVFSRWPFVVDLPLMHYVAWRVNAGDAPYVDVWDMNGPVAYMLHQLFLLSPLPAGQTMPVLMTLVTSGCVAGVAAIASRRGRYWLGLAAGVVMLAWILARGNDYVMQRDTLIGGLVLGALVLMMGARAKGWRWAGAGVLLALAVGVKPTAAPFALLAFAAAVWIDIGEGKSFRRAIWLAVGGTAGATVWIGWLAVTGGLAGFWHMMATYNPAYAQIARAPLTFLLREPSVSLGLAAMIGCAVAFMGRRRADASRDEQVLVLLAGAFAGVAAALYVMQGKGWAYQSAPAIILGVAAGAVALSTVEDFSGRARMLAVAGGVGVTLLAAAGGIRYQMSPAFAERYQTRVDVVGDMAADLAGLPPGMKVQPLDTTDGALNAMTLTKRAPASPVMYDFWLFEGSSEAIEASRAAVLAGLHAKERPAILMTNQGWPHEGAGFARMSSWTEFKRILDEDYTLVGEGRRGGHGYRLYAPS